MNINVELEKPYLQCKHCYFSLICRFDGHAGSKCSDWCEKNLLNVFIECYDTSLTDSYVCL